MNTGLIEHSTDGLDGVTPGRWLEWRKAEYVRRERRRIRGNQWVAPEHMAMGKYMRRYPGTRNLIMPEPDAIRLQEAADHRLQFRLDNSSEGR